MSKSCLIFAPVTQSKLRHLRKGEDPSERMLHINDKTDCWLILIVVGMLYY